MTDDKKFAPVFGVVSQFVKDLSFENFVNFDFKPNDGDEPKLDIQVKVGSQKAKDNNLYCVDLFLSVNAKAGATSIFLLELTYSGMFVLENFSDEMMMQALNIECPRLLFPFARAVVGSTVAAGNMPMPLLPPIDFADLFLKNNTPANKE